MTDQELQVDNTEAVTKSEPQPNAQLDQLLNKYVAVWLWSILFGTTTGVLYSFLSFRYDRWGGLGLIIVIPAIASLMYAILSWIALYRALSRYLIPRYILDCQDIVTSDEAKRVFAYMIKRSFLFFVFAAAFRAVASLVELALAISSGRG